MIVRPARAEPRAPAAAGAARYPRLVRIALAHDWLVGLRGGELVLDRIARALAPHAGVTRIYTMFDDGRPLTPALDALPRTVSRIGRFGLPAWRRWLLPLYPVAVAELSRRLADDHARAPIDLLISTSSAAIKALRPPTVPGSSRPVPHLCYCHSPARYAWSQTAEYAREHAARAMGLALAGPAFRGWDRRTAGRVTRFVANSAHTAAEVARCYGRRATVLHPPVRTGFFTPEPGVERGRHWLLVAALEPYKRVDLAIDAARAGGVPLRIAGEGSAGAVLRERARGAPVTFLGRISDDSLRDEYRRARLVLFPQVEDFGIVAVEAQACGTPVVARRAGGALDAVVEHRTGAMFTDPEPGALLAAALRCPDDWRACRAQAERFAEARFDAAVLAHVSELVRVPRGPLQSAASHHGSFGDV